MNLVSRFANYIFRSIRLTSRMQETEKVSLDQHFRKNSIVY
jgi:hypothetical protein